jgi:hypothetical protein
MNTLTDKELIGINGGMQSALTELGEHLAADGLTYMDSNSKLKASGGLFVAAAGGWLWAFGSAYDGLMSLFGW